MILSYPSTHSEHIVIQYNSNLLYKKFSHIIISVNFIDSTFLITDSIIDLIAYTYTIQFCTIFMYKTSFSLKIGYFWTKLVRKQIQRNLGKET